MTGDALLYEQLFPWSHQPLEHGQHTCMHACIHTCALFAFQMASGRDKPLPPKASLSRLRQLLVFHQRLENPRVYFIDVHVCLEVSNKVRAADYSDGQPVFPVIYHEQVS